MKNKKEFENNIQCVGFIMDGNRRFGKERGAGEMSGHLAGKEKFLEVMEWVIGLKIPHAVFYAFSTENWLRKKVEIKHLMVIFRELLIGILEKEKPQFKIKIIGQLDDFPNDIQELVKKLEVLNKENEKKIGENKVLPLTTIWVALSYGGRKELLSAMDKMKAEKLEISEENLKRSLWSADLPDLDLLIRTGGEKRLSNFLPWQIAYTELFFSDSHWPAFTKIEFLGILEEYGRRVRRFGK